MVDSSERQEADAAAEHARSSYFSEDSLGYHIRTQLLDGRLLLSSIQDLWAISVETDGQSPSPNSPRVVAEVPRMRDDPSHLTLAGLVTDLSQRHLIASCLSP